MAGEQTSLSGWWVLVGTDPPCGNLSALPSAPLWLHSPLWLWSYPALPPTVSAREGVSSVWTPFLLHSSLPLVQVPSYSFVSVFSFFVCPTQVCGEFLAFWEVWGLLPAFSRCSVGVVLRVDVFLMYLWGGRWSPRLTFPPSWSPSMSFYFGSGHFLEIVPIVFPFFHSANSPMPFFFKKIIFPGRWYTVWKSLPCVPSASEPKSMAFYTEESHLLIISVWIIYCLFAPDFLLQNPACARTSPSFINSSSLVNFFSQK